MPYKIIKIPKRKGGFRILHIPDDDLKKQQKEILHHELAIIKYPKLKNTIILGQHKCSPSYIFKFINAQFYDPNPDEIFLTACDIKNFFTNVTPDYLLNIFYKWSNSKFINIVEKCFVEYKGKLILPQGAPTSPRLSSFALFKLFRMFDYIFKYKAVAIINYIDNFYMFHSDKKMNKYLVASILNYGFKISKFKCRKIPYKSENKPFVKMLGFTIYRDDYDGKIVAKIRQKHSHTIRGLQHHLEKNYDENLHKKLMGYRSWKNIIEIMNK